MYGLAVMQTISSSMIIINDKVAATNRDSSLHNLYKMTLVVCTAACAVRLSSFQFCDAILGTSLKYCN